MRLAHPDLDQGACEALGIRSLRHHHEVDDATTVTLPCPSLAQIRERLGFEAASPCLAALLELLEVADLLGCPRLYFAIDLRHHPSQSLLHAGLADFQGPALCVVMAGVTAGSEELCELMAPRSASTPLIVRGRMASHASLGLLSCFAITQVRSLGLKTLQVVFVRSI